MKQIFPIDVPVFCAKHSKPLAGVDTFIVGDVNLLEVGDLLNIDARFECGCRLPCVAEVRDAKPQ